MPIKEKIASHALALVEYRACHGALGSSPVRLGYTNGCRRSGRANPRRSFMYDHSSKASYSWKTTTAPKHIIQNTPYARNHVSVARLALCDDAGGRHTPAPVGVSSWASTTRPAPCPARIFTSSSRADMCMLWGSG